MIPNSDPPNDSEFGFSYMIPNSDLSQLEPSRKVPPQFGSSQLGTQHIVLTRAPALTFIAGGCLLVNSSVPGWSLLYFLGSCSSFILLFSGSGVFQLLSLKEGSKVLKAAKGVSGLKVLKALGRGAANPSKAVLSFCGQADP